MNTDNTVSITVSDVKRFLNTRSTPENETFPAFLSRFIAFHLGTDDAKEVFINIIDVLNGKRKRGYKLNSRNKTYNLSDIIESYISFKLQLSRRRKKSP